VRSPAGRSRPQVAPWRPGPFHSHGRELQDVTFVTAQRSVHRFCERAVRPGQLLLGPFAACGILVAISEAEAADDVELISKLGEFQQSQSLVSSYSVNKDLYYLDLTISPITPVPAGEAGFAGRTTCSLGAQDLATKLEHAWTVRVFVPGEPESVYTCEIPASPAKTPAAPAPRRKRSR
jgi:hypothetical protein